MTFDFDIIVVGAGHAGCEAAHAAARLGVHTLLITIDLEKIAQMSCNPAIGGIAKGQIVREIDALGGMMGIVADKTAIQYRMLNRSKGPAMWSPRAQADRNKYSALWRSILENADNLSLWQGSVDGLTFDSRGFVSGVTTAEGATFNARKVILTTGTFLNGLMHIGQRSFAGGRFSEPASHGLTEQLAARGFRTARMKTGTPVRIDGRTIDFDKAAIQEGDKADKLFSYLPEVHGTLQKRPCHIVHTNAETCRILREGLPYSPLYNGQIQSIGPRYCPSIETKIVTFADKTDHQLFLEPEGETTQEYYLNGFSSSMPLDIQVRAIHTIPALSHAQLYRPGYAIEYDYFDPTQLHPSLETRLVPGLYFAGQINGTTGYEEAAGQGLLAGINAALAIRGEQPLILGRDSAYIGVLIDDLVNKGVDEPYRMFTSRAEYRILLRQDDADMRLTHIGYGIGLADEHRMKIARNKRTMRDRIIELTQNTTVRPEEAASLLESVGSAPLKQSVRLYELAKRPDIGLKQLADIAPALREEISHIEPDMREETVEAAEILIKYDGYIRRERALADKLGRLEDIRLSEATDYASMHSLSTEARQKLTAHKPSTIGAASRIPGVSPSDINILLLALGR